jgi:hypothetical protein
MALLSAEWAGCQEILKTTEKSPAERLEKVGEKVEKPPGGSLAFLIDSYGTTEARRRER